MTRINARLHVLPRKLLVTALLAAGLFATAPAYAYDNPVDPVSNPQGLEFSDVEMDLPDYAPPFQRSGPIESKTVYQKIVAGLPAAKVTSLLGQPLSQTDGKAGTEWNYNFTLQMPQSKNYLVCQYKVVFDDQEQVKETVWRRDQCLDIAQQAAR